MYESDHSKSPKSSVWAKNRIISQVFGAKGVSKTLKLLKNIKDFGRKGNRNGLRGQE